MKSQQRRTPAKKQRQNKVLTDDQIKVLEGASSASSATTIDTVVGASDNTIDLSNYGAACDTLSISSLTTNDILTLDTSSLTTITLPSVSYVGGGGASGSCYTATTGTSCYPTWTTTGTNYTLGGISVSPPTVNINTDGIEIKEGGDLKVDGKSLKDFMTKMEQRLAILVPDPAKLEKFEALKKAYEHYKTMESLCFDEPKDEENK